MRPVDRHELAAHGRRHSGTCQTRIRPVIPFLRLEAMVILSFTAQAAHLPDLLKGAHIHPGKTSRMIPLRA
jgi:hypothetical protein